jgi:hypothetical protein
MSTASLGLQETLSNSNVATAVSGSIDDAAITQAANEENARKEEVGQAMSQEGAEQTSKRPDRSKECRLDQLFDFAQRDLVEARRRALQYIRENKPEHAEKICYVSDDDGRNEPFIQLPCKVPRINPETGNIVGQYELPLLYVVQEDDVGRSLYIGQSYPAGMTLTRYDGKLVPSDEVVKATWARSMNYRGWAIDGQGYGDYSQIQSNSLGHIANHQSPGSAARYTHRP